MIRGNLDRMLREAAANEDLGYPVPRAVRLRLVKRGLTRIARLYLDRQVRVNRALRLGLEELAVALGERLDLIQRQMLSELQEGDADLQSALTVVQQELRELRASLGEGEERYREEQVHMRRLKAQVDRVVSTVRRSLPSPEPEQVAGLPRAWDGLYEAFEDEFRGPFDDIKERLRPYLDELPAADVQHPVLDLGCGRGEWLELMLENEICAYGVDSNDQAVERAEERGVRVVRGDALDHLRSLEPESISVVTAFHLAEHLAPNDLIELFDLALCALRPGGLLLLETPNPGNLIVAASTFYLDPTHMRPLHPELLSFLARARGYVDIEVRSMNGSRTPSLENVDNPELAPIVELLREHLASAPDYALLARRLKEAPSA